MEIYLVRHGIAVGREEDMPDPLRPLTEKGRRRFRKTARAFARLGRKIGLILTSPLVRAVQTAEILAGATEHREVAVLEELDPGVGIAQLLEALGKRVGKSKTVALVGHEPQLSSVLSALCGVSQEEFDLKKGAIVRVDVASLPRPRFVAPRWWLKPRAGTRVKGLPLKGDGKSEVEASTVGRRKRKRAERSAARRRSSRSAKPRRASRGMAGLGAPPATTLLHPVTAEPTQPPAPDNGVPPPSPAAS